VREALRKLQAGGLVELNRTPLYVRREAPKVRRPPSRIGGSGDRADPAVERRSTYAAGAGATEEPCAPPELHRARVRAPRLVASSPGRHARSCGRCRVRLRPRRLRSRPRPDRSRLLVLARRERGRTDGEETVPRPARAHLRFPSRERLGDEERSRRHLGAAPVRHAGGAGEGGVDGSPAADLPRPRHLQRRPPAQPGRRARGGRRQDENGRGARARARRDQRGHVLLPRGRRSSSTSAASRP